MSKMAKKDKRAIFLGVVFLTVVAVVASKLFSWKFVLVQYTIVPGSFSLMFLLNHFEEKKQKRSPKKAQPRKLLDVLFRRHRD